MEKNHDGNFFLRICECFCGYACIGHFDGNIKIEINCYCRPKPFKNFLRPYQIEIDIKKPWENAENNDFLKENKTLEEKSFLYVSKSSKFWIYSFCFKIIMNWNKTLPQSHRHRLFVLLIYNAHARMICISDQWSLITSHNTRRTARFGCGTFMCSVGVIINLDIKLLTLSV